TVTSAYDSPSPVSGWFDSGSGITESVTSPVSGGSGVQHVCTGWTGTGSIPASGGSSSVTFTINAASTIVWNWKTQYQITFDQTGVGSDYTGTVVTVDGVNYGVNGLSVMFWFDSGSGHSFSFASPLVVGSKQYNWSSTSGLSTFQSGTLSVTASGSVVGNYIIQNQITFDQVGVSSDFTGTVITVDSVSYSRSQLPVSFTWTVGSLHSFAFQSPLIVGANSKQYVWTSTTGLSSLQSGSITVSAYGSIIGNYKTQYYFTATSPYDSPSPSSGWFDSGSGITESVTSPVSGGSGVQFVCTGWTGTGSVPASGSGSSVTFTIGAASAITWGWKTQYYLTVTSAYDSPSPVSGWFDSGSGITESVTSPVSGGSGVQFVCTGWTGTGSVPASGSGLSLMFTIATPSNIVWNWKTQYTVTFGHTGLDSSASGTIVIVSGVPVNFGQLPYNAWVDNGASITYSYGNVSSSNSGERFNLLGVSGLPSPATVTGTMTITGNYQIQYQITFGQTGVGTDATGTVLTVDSNTYVVSTLPVSFWWDSGSSHSFAFVSPLSVNASLQYSWSSTSGLATTQSGSLLVSGSGSMTGNYVAQISYQITFDPGVGPDWTGTVLTVDGVNYTEAELPVSFWWTLDSVHSFAFQSPLVVSPNVKQYVWTSTTGLSTSQSGSIVVTVSGSVIGYYKTQYYLTLATSPTGTDTPTGAGWYDAGTNATISTDAYVDIVPGLSRYRFNGWTTSNMTEISDPTRIPTNVSMDVAQTVTANYVAQYRVTVDQAGVGSDFTDAIVSMDLVNYTEAQLPRMYWLDNGTSHDFTFQSPLVVTVNGKQYVWTSTTGLSSSRVGTLVVSGSGNLTGTYKTQFYFSSSSPHGSPTPANGWFDDGASIAAQVTSPTPGATGVQYLCIGWTGSGSAQISGTGSSTSFTISQASSITWAWKTQYYLTLVTNPASVPGAGWYDSSTNVNLVAPPVSGYTFLTWDVDGTFRGAGVTSISVTMDGPHVATAYYNSNTPTSTTSVGGYSMLMVRKPSAWQMGAYLTLVAMFAFALSFMRRKRR
ncbi:MAG: hypothetical protein ABSG57_07505, partial [Candidatus Bathyarchaeia archaeon]